MLEESHVHGAYDHVLEHVAKNDHTDSFAGRIAVMIAILSTTGVAFGYQGGAMQNAALLTKNEATIHKIEAASRWVYYQAEDRRRMIAGLTAQLSGANQAVARHETQCYAAEERDVCHQAEDQERLAKEADDASELVVHHHHW